MYKSINYNRLFWIVHTIGWFLAVFYTFFKAFEVYIKAPASYYFITSVLVLYGILPVLRVIYKKMLKKSGINTTFIIKVLIIIFIVGMLRRLQDFLLYIVLNIKNESFLSLIENVYNQQIVNFRFLRMTLDLSLPVFIWTFLYLGIKSWFDLTEEREKSERSYLQARDAELKLLRYQLNPHFLFNSLNSVQALIYENREFADKMLTELSEFLRYSLEHKGKVFVPFRDEVEAINKYLTIEKIRFEEKLEFKIKATQDANNCKIPSFLLQPLVENAIKHGIRTSKIPLEISMEAKTNDNYLNISISNTGEWIQKKEVDGNGIENVENRLKNVYGDQYRFLIIKEYNRVTVQIEIPKDEEND